MKIYRVASNLEKSGKFEKKLVSEVREFRKMVKEILNTKKVRETHDVYLSILSGWNANFFLARFARSMLLKINY